MRRSSRPLHNRTIISICAQRWLPIASLEYSLLWLSYSQHAQKTINMAWLSYSKQRINLLKLRGQNRMEWWKISKIHRKPLMSWLNGCFLSVSANWILIKIKFQIFFATFNGFCSVGLPLICTNNSFLMLLLLLLFKFSIFMQNTRLKFLVECKNAFSAPSAH